MAAIVSGCYAVSSNRAGFDGNGQEFGGGGWIFDPLGDLIAETSPDSPLVAADFDFDLVERVREEYTTWKVSMGTRASCLHDLAGRMPKKEIFMRSQEYSSFIHYLHNDLPSREEYPCYVKEYTSAEAHI